MEKQISPWPIVCKLDNVLSVDSLAAVGGQQCFSPYAAYAAMGDEPAGLVDPGGMKFQSRDIIPFAPPPNFGGFLPSSLAFMGIGPNGIDLDGSGQDMDGNWDMGANGEADMISGALMKATFDAISGNSNLFSLVNYSPFLLYEMGIQIPHTPNEIRPIAGGPGGEKAGDGDGTQEHPFVLNPIDVKGERLDGGGGGSGFWDHLGDYGLVLSALGVELEESALKWGAVAGKYMDYGGDALGIAGLAYEVYLYKKGSLGLGRVIYDGTGEGLSLYAAYTAGTIAGLGVGAFFLYGFTVYEGAKYIGNSLETSYNHWSHNYLGSHIPGYQ